MKCTHHSDLSGIASEGAGVDGIPRDHSQVLEVCAPMHFREAVVDKADFVAVQTSMHSVLSAESCLVFSPQDCSS